MTLRGDKLELGAYGSLSVDDAKSFIDKHGQEALAYTREKLLEAKKYADEGEWTWKIGGFLAGVSIVVVSVFGFLSDFFGLAPVNAVLDLYLVAIGLILAVLEYKQHFLTQPYLNALRREALFLYRPYGRAAIYFFVGLLLMTYSGLFGKMAGLFSAVVGVVVFYSSRSAIQHLETMRTSMRSEAQVTSRFMEFDKDNSGTLETKELASLCKSLGSPLTLNELESAIFILDKNGDGKIELNEFLSFWLNRDDSAV
eukprot:gene13366-9570_t